MIDKNLKQSFAKDLVLVKISRNESSCHSWWGTLKLINLLAKSGEETYYFKQGIRVTNKKTIGQ